MGVARGVDFPDGVGAPLRARTDSVKPDGMSMPWRASEMSCSLVPGCPLIGAVLGTSVVMGGLTSDTARLGAIQPVPPVLKSDGP